MGRISKTLSRKIETGDVHAELVEWGKDLPARSWDAEVYSTIEERVDELTDEVSDAVDREIKTLGEINQDADE